MATALQPRIILRDIKETTLQDYSKCANCQGDLEDDTAHSFHDEFPVFDQSVKILDSLNDLIDLRKKLHLSTVLFDEFQLKLCDTCFKVLAAVYISLAHFISTSNKPSFLSDILRCHGAYARIRAVQDDPVQDEDTKNDPDSLDEHSDDEISSSLEEHFAELDVTELLEESPIESENETKKESEQKSNKRIRTSQNAKVHKCQICWEKFSRTNHLTRHMKVHRQSTYTCDICQAGFRCQLRWEEHVKMHERNEIGNESNLGESQLELIGIKSEARLTSHIEVGETGNSDQDEELMQENGSKKREGDDANSGDVKLKLEEANTPSEVKKRRGSGPYLKNIKRYKCAECGQMFSRNYHLRRHMKCHSVSKYSCEICGAGYRFLSKYEEHVREHDPNYVRERPKKPDSAVNGEKRRCEKVSHLYKKLPEGIECLVCGRIMHSSRSIHSHLLSHKGDAEKEYVCEVCGVSFKTVQGLRLHKVTHSEVRDFLCNECGMAFKRRHHLRDHVLTQHQITEAKFICEYPECGKKFRRIKGLRRHVVIHRGLKFPCEHGCGAVYTNKFNRKIHYDTNCKNFPKELKKGDGRRKKQGQGKTSTLVDTVDHGVKTSPLLTFQPAVSHENYDDDLYV